MLPWQFRKQRKLRSSKQTSFTCAVVRVRQRAEVVSESESETVARIELDAETRPKHGEQSCGRGETERNPSGEEDSERKNRYLGQV